MQGNVRLEYYYKGKNNRPLPNAVAVIMHGKVLYFSYKTLIAFESHGQLYISENIWSNTTGKHLNAINRNKEKRIPYESFSRLAEVFL